MKNLSDNLKNRKLNISSLSNFGFRRNIINYHYEELIVNYNFKVVIDVENNKVNSKVIDLKMNDEYLLVDVEDSIGEFVGKIKQEYQKIITRFLNECTSIDVF